jgi:hypothetical protein
MDMVSATALLIDYIDCDIPALLKGSPGVGKSSLPRQIVKSRANWGYCEFRPNLFESIDLRGLPITDPVTGTTVWLRPNNLPFVGNEDRFPAEGILNIDEITAGTSASMLAVCLGLVLERRAGEHTLMPGWRIVATTNLATDKSGIVKMGAALSSRFAHIPVEATAKALVKWGIENGFHHTVAAYLRFRPTHVHVMTGLDLTGPWPNPRNWERCSNLVKLRGFDGNELRRLTGIVGADHAADFVSFIRVYDDLPNIEEIAAQPNNAHVPTEMSAVYATVGMCAAEADLGNFANIMTYAARLPKEYEVMTILDSTKQKPALCKTATYNKWFVANQDHCKLY